MLITQPVKGVKIYRTIFLYPGGCIRRCHLHHLGLDLKHETTGAELSALSAGNRRVPTGWSILPGRFWPLFWQCVWRRNHDADFLYGYQEYSHRSIRGGFLRRRQSGETVLFHPADYPPTILFNLITSLISAFQQLTLVMLLTNGGPLKSTYFYGMFTYNNAFKHHKLGYASAQRMVMFVIILFFNRPCIQVLICMGIL